MTLKLAAVALLPWLPHRCDVIPCLSPFHKIFISLFPLIFPGLRQCAEGEHGWTEEERENERKRKSQGQSHVV